MPKTIEGVTAQFKKTLVVPQPGEQRVIGTLETPIRDLLNNTLNLLSLIVELTTNLEGHTHAIVTDTTPGFMSPTDRQSLSGLATAIQNHAHALATTTTSGFMSASDKTKLNSIESGAQTVTRERIETALGIKYGELVVPATTIGANQTKVFEVNMPGVKFADSVAASEYGNDKFSVSYHCISDAVQVLVRNRTNSSTAYAATVNFMVFSR